MLKDFLNERTVRLQAECRDWVDAVRQAGELLISDGAVTEQYIEDVLDNVRQAGPYIVVAEHIAIPHAVRRDGVVRSGMSLLTLRTPVEFGHPKNDPVSIVFMLAGKKNDDHMESLMMLAELLEDRRFREMLETKTDEKNILDYIRMF